MSAEDELMEVHVVNENHIVTIVKNDVYISEYDPTVGWKTHKALDLAEHIEAAKASAHGWTGSWRR
jgi:hypothetical protein